MNLGETGSWGQGGVEPAGRHVLYEKIINKNKKYRKRKNRLIMYTNKIYNKIKQKQAYQNRTKQTDNKRSPKKAQERKAVKGTHLFLYS